MKKSTRIVSLLLVLLMLVGMMPLALFAADEVNDGGTGAATSGVYHDGKPVGLPTDQQLADAGLTNKLRVDLNSVVIPDDDEDGIIDATNTGSLGFTDSAGALNYIKEADGNIAVLMGRGDIVCPEDSGSTNSRIQAYPQANLNEYGKNGRDFVFQMDVKLTGDTPVPGSLMNAMSRVKGDSPISVELVKLQDDGTLTDGAGHSVGRLNSGTYTTVAAKVDLTQNKYWIYVNGVCQYAEGVTFLTDAKVAEFQAFLDAGTGVDESKYGFAAGSTYDVTRYWLEGIRILQSATTTDGAKLLPDRSILMDNFAIYYKATGNGIDYVGEFEASADEITDAFISENGYFYYVKDGYRLANGTHAVEGGSTHKFEKDGKVLSVAERVSLVDFVKHFAGKYDASKKTYTYDGNIVNGLYLAQYPINSNTYFYRGSGSSAQNITFTANSELAAADILSYDTVELNLYTEEVQKNTYFALLINYKDPTGGTAKPRIRCEFNLSAGAITGYNTSGTKSAFGGGIATPVDGWGSVKGVNVLKENGVTDIETEDLVLTSIVAYASGVGGTANYLDANGKVMLNANSTFALTSVNLVKFGAPATSVSEISGGGWVRVYDPSAETADTYYYAPWTQEYVKDAVIEDKGVGYAFDADGKLIGFADGVHTVQDGKTYLYMNGEKAYGNADGKVTYKGVTYRVYGDGVISTASVIPFFDYGYTYDNAFTNCTRNESTVYVNNAVFDDLKINGKETGYYGVHNDAGYTSGGATALYSNFNFVHKFSSFELLYKEGSTTDKVLRLHNWGNHYFDAYVNYKPSSAKTQLVIEYDVKLGTDWDTTGSMMQLISRYEKSDIFSALTRIDQTGIVYLEVGSKAKIAKVSTEEYTRFSYVFKVVNTGNTADVVLDSGTENVSLYDVYADIYVNGVKLASDVLLVNDRYVPDMDEFRMFQYGNANTGSIYLDNLSSYVADVPQYVADVELKNGFVKEGNIVRYYENGIMKINTTFDASESVDGDTATYKADGYGALNASGVKELGFGSYKGTTETGTKVEYGYKGYNGNALVKDELYGFEFIYDKISYKEMALYDKLYIDIYLPEDTWTGAGKPADSWVQFAVGEVERFYPLTDNGNGTYTYDRDNYVTSGPTRVEVDKQYVTITNNTFDADGNKIYAVAQLAEDANGNQYARVWAYAGGGELDLATLNVGWNTVQLNINKSYDLDKIQLAHTGWNLNKKGNATFEKTWSTDTNTVYEVANGDVSYSFAVANPRLVDSDYVLTEVPGWNDTNTKYNYFNELLTGLHRIDGVYRDFDNGGVIADGLLDVPGYVYENKTLVPVTAKREFVNGVLLTADTNGYTLGMEGKIEVNYYLDLSVLPKTDTYVEFTVNGEVQKFNLKDADYVEGQGYKATVAIAAAEMTDKISAVVKYADGTVLYTLDDYSAIDYAQTILTSDKYGANAKAAVKAMLNYATAAQVQFNKTGTPANDILDEAERTVANNATEINGKASSSVRGSVNGVTYKSTTLGLEGETAIYHFFNVTDTDLSKYTVDGATEKVMLGNVLRVKVAGIKAAQLDEVYTVTVTYGSETLTVNANAFAYAKAVVNSASVSESLKNVMNALYEYNVAAEAYNANPNA